MQLSNRFKTLRRRLGAEWEDVVQQAKLHCLKHKDKNYYEQYLTRTIHNIAINWLEHRAVVDMVSLGERAFSRVGSTPEVDLAAPIDLERFMREHWTQQERDAIFLALTGQVSYEEAGEMLGKSRRTMYRWLKEVRGIFCREMPEYGSGKI